MFGVTTKTCECGHAMHTHGDRAVAACLMRVKPENAEGSYCLSVPCPCLGWKPTTLG